MKIIKISERNPISGELVFDSNNVRRLEGILFDYKDYSEKAIEEMNSWKDNDEYGISYQEALNRLQYYLDRMNIK